MREILFRGKSVNDGRWVFGDLSNYGDCKTITTVKDFSILDSCEVIPETVGQYTGLKDVHYKRVFEGDIVKDIIPLCKGLSLLGREKLLKERMERRGIAVVKFGYHDVKAEDPYCVGRAYGVYFEGDTALTTPAQYFGYGYWQENEDNQFEVIGNIWDNPELLEGET